MKKQFTRLIATCCVPIFLLLISTTGAFAQYCDSHSNDNSGAGLGEWMTNVSFAGIDNSSGNTLYEDFTDVYGSVVAGVTYPFSTDISSDYTEYVTVYIDWDQSETFEESERYDIGSSSCNSSCTISDDIDVPITAFGGETRMRVILSYNAAIDGPCNTTFTFGEVEDYSLNVISGECEPPNIDFEVVNNCEDSTYNVVATVNSMGMVNDSTANEFFTMHVTRSDQSTTNQQPFVPALIGLPVTIASNIPFGVTVHDSIVAGNPMCTLIRDFEQEICPAPNDEICDAISLSCGDTLIDMPFIGATQSIDDECFGAGVEDVWFSFTTDGSVKYKFSEISGADIVVSVYSGSSCNDTTEYLPCQDYPEDVTITEAGTYFVRLRPYFAGTDFYSVALECIPFDCPDLLKDIGDSCNDGDPITVNDIIQSDCSCVGDTVVANDEPCTASLIQCGEEFSDQTFIGSTQSVDDDCFGSGVGDVWWKFIADGTQTYYIEETQSDVVVDLWKGDNCQAPVQVEDCVDIGEHFTVTEAGTYYFRLRPYSSATTYGVALTCTPFDCPDLGNIGGSCDDQDPSTVNDEITEDCECVGIPQAPNDEICNATELVCNELLEGEDMTGATASIIDDCYLPENGDIWYKFTTTIGEAYTVDIEGDGPSSTALTSALYMAADCDSLIELLPCNTFSIGYIFTEADTVATYYVRVRPYSNAESLNIRLQCGTPPDNGECTTAEAITCGETYTGSTLASPELGDNLSFCGISSFDEPDPDNGGVWYTYTPTDSTRATFDLSGSTFNTTMFLYSNTCDSLVCVTGDYSSGEGDASKIVQDLSGGETYYLLISGYGNNRGAYTLNVNCLQECSGTPSAGTIDSDMLVCSDLPINLIATGATDDVFGVEFVWQSSPTGEDDWTDIEGSNSADFLYIDGITEPTYFRLKATCTASGESDYSNVMSATINPVPTDCYCTPIGTNDSRYIDNFVTTGGTENITNQSSGFSTYGYGDFTSMTVSQMQTDSVHFDASFVGGTFGFRIWVDWNQDGVFDTENEVAYQSDSYEDSHSGSFVVPQTALAGTTRMRVVNHWLSTTGDVDPCVLDFTYGEFEDYSFEVVPLPGCSGTPSAGTAVNDNILSCATVPLTLSVSGASEPATALVRNWQSSPAGADTWTDIEGAIDPTYVLEDGITEATDFRYVVTCENSIETDISNTIEATINTNIEDCYCTPEATNDERYIESFSTTNGIENVTNDNSGFSPGGYGDFTSMTVSQMQTDTVYFDALFSPGPFGNTYGFRIWVDWNHDGSFDEVNEVAYQSDSYATAAAGYFVVPHTALAGTTRMRIMNDYLSPSGDTPPCETGFSDGEFEDYSFEVIALPGCSGTPSAGVADNDNVFICANAPLTLSVSGASDPATALDRNWQSSPAGADTWTDIDGATEPTYVIADGITEDTDFRYVVTCENSNETDISNTIEATINTNVTECYCIPTTANNTYYITDFTASGNGVQDIDNSGSGPSLDGTGYSDFTFIPALTASSGGEVDFTASVNSASNAGFRIWIDWNQNGSFEDEGEVVYSSIGYLYTHTGSFGVPSDAAGSYRMRIASSYIPIGGPDSPCELPTWGGEYEDYMVSVSAASAVTLTGTVNWNSNCGERDVTVDLYEPGTANLVGNYTATVASDGSFSVEDLNIGTYDIIVKVDGYLSKGTEDVEINSGNNSLDLGAIIGGDIISGSVGDPSYNTVNYLDVSAFSSAFGHVSGDPAYNLYADFNCDGTIGLLDISSFSSSYGLSGDEAPLGN